MWGADLFGGLDLATPSTLTSSLEDDCYHDDGYQAKRPTLAGREPSATRKCVSKAWVTEVLSL